MAKKFKQNDNNLAICYYRYSSHEQNDASIEQQQEAAQKYAFEHGYTIIKEYEDRAKSGTSTEGRYGYLTMLAEVSSLKPAALICWKIDRLGRDRYELTDAKRKIRSAGCRIELVAEMTPEDTPEGALLESMMDGMAEYYSRNLSQNILRGMGYNAANFLYNGHKLFGYSVDSTKHYVLDPDTAPVAERIFVEYVQGKRMKDIAADLNAEGRRTTRGVEFTHNSIRSILKNPAYKGTYRWNDIETDFAIPAVVSPELWRQAQDKMKKNKHQSSQKETENAPRYWLTGKLYCGECGEPMSGEYAVSKTKRRYYYYRCTTKDCDMKRISKSKIEEAVTTILKSILCDDGNRASLAADASAYYKEHYTDTHYIDGLRSELKDTRCAINNLLSALEKGAISDSVIERLNDLETRKRGLQQAIDIEEAKEALAENDTSIKAYFERFSNIDFDDETARDQVLQYFIDKIYVFKDKLLVTGWFSDGSTELTIDDWSRFLNDDAEDPDIRGRTEFETFAPSSTIHMSRVSPR